MEIPQVRDDLGLDQVKKKKKVELVRRCWRVMSILFKTTRFAERLHFGSESKREIFFFLSEV